MISGFARRPSVAACALSLMTVLAGAGSVAQAQLRVLSQGDVDAQWRDAQVALLNQQLQDPKVRGQLKSELSSQARWLAAWQPGKLSEQALLPPTKIRNRLSEPIIDPNELASKLRKRLLGSGARPTVRDTKTLEKMLAEHSGDVGVRQLHLHWLDQRQYRKTYPDEIADAAIRLAGLLEQLKPQTDKVKRARAYCLYRRGRALAYRELPDVVAKTPIEDPKQHEADLLGAYAQLTAMAGQGRPEFILLDIRMLRRDHWNGRALALLESHAPVIEKQWFLKKRRDLLRDLGWPKPAEEAAAVYAAQFPEAVAEEQRASGGADGQDPAQDGEAEGENADE